MDPLPPMHKHSTPNYLLQISFQNEKVNFYLFCKDRDEVFKKTLAYEQFPTEMRNNCESIEEVFQLLSDKQIFTINHEEGIITLLIKSIRKNKIIEVPSHLTLNRSYKEKKLNKGEIPEHFYKEFLELKEEVKVLRQKVNYIIPQQIKLNVGNDEEKVKLVGQRMEKNPLMVSQDQMKALTIRLNEAQKEIQQLKALIKKQKVQEEVKVEVNQKVEEKKQGQVQVFGKDEFDKKMRKFQAQMKEWQKVIQEETKKFKWSIQYSHIVNGTYVGRGQNGKPHGFGIITKENHKVYAKWVNGVAEGRVIYQPGNNVHFQQRKSGNRHGLSICYYQDGRRQQLEFKDGKHNGILRTYRKDGTLEEDAKYENGSRTSWVNY